MKMWKGEKLHGADRLLTRAQLKTSTPISAPDFAEVNESMPATPAM